MEERCTSSGPSAIRKVRAYEYLERKVLFKNDTYFIGKDGRQRAYICASGTSPDTPAPPYTCIAQSVTLQTILAAATLIMAI